jgi:hypothetical protein
MSAQPPPIVAGSPGVFHHLSTQDVVFTRDGASQVRIAVALDWVPGPSGLPWIPVIVVLFAAGVLGAVSARSWRLLALLVGLLVVSDVAHAIGFEIPRPGANPTKFVQFLGGSFVAIAVWIAAIPTVIGLVRRRVEAFYGVVFVALLIALIGGATDLSALWKSQLPDAGPAWLTRVEVVIALGLGGGLVAGALFRMVRSRAVTHPDGRGQWLSLLVTGLSDAELARIARELDPDDVLEVALRELAARAQPIADSFENGSALLVVTDQAPPVVWSLARTEAGDIRAVGGRVEPVAIEIRAPFAVTLQLLAGTLPLGDATARDLVETSGDPEFLAQLAPIVSETALPDASTSAS